jgi:hypothetical protein
MVQSMERPCKYPKWIPPASALNPVGLNSIYWQNFKKKAILNYCVKNTERK